MNKTITLKAHAHLVPDEIRAVENLEALVMSHDQIALKLELGYKKSVFETKGLLPDTLNDFVAYDQEQVIAYISLMQFGQATSTIEINGMVHPDYRRQGIFRGLMAMVQTECKKRGANKLLLLSDRLSPSGQGFIKSLTKTLHHTEYEMYLDAKAFFSLGQPHQTIQLRRAINEDAQEVATQNSLYFKEETDEEAQLVMPEEEAKRGFLIYLGIAQDKIIGKVNLKISDTVSGIYGLGIKPAFRSQGYGRALLYLAVQEIMSLTTSQIMLQVEATNDKALNLYTSCGFKPTSTMDYYTFDL